VRGIGDPEHDPEHVPFPGAVLFDLDGTLTDPRVGMRAAFAHGLAAVGITVAADASLDSLIGPPAQDGLSLRFGLVEPTLSVAVAAFRAYLWERGAYENEPIPGMPELVAEVAGSGVRVGVATSKPTNLATVILDHFDLLDAIEFVGGAEPDGSRRHKRDVIVHALDGLGVPAGPHVAMVGDREHDVIGARLTGLTAVGVLWGFGTRDELVDAGADAVAATVDELRAHLLGPARG
jgi:phosphoglycolate phosphatase